MKTLLSPLPLLAALVACDGTAETEQPAAPDVAETVQAAPPVAAGPSPSPVPSAIPATLRGRWGLVTADCEPGRDDAKGLLTITEQKLEFYESVGTLDEIEEAGANRIRAEFDFMGEGQEWEREVILEAQDGGTVLVRRENGADAAPGEFRYTKCG